MIVSASMAYLIASAVSAFGYYPITGGFTLDIIESIEQQREKAIQRRSRYARMGFVFFSIGVILSVISVAVIVHSN